MTRRTTTFLALLALGGGAFAQNAFRPLPELPDLNEWPGAHAAPISRAEAWFNQLEADADQPQPRTFVEVRAIAEASKGADFDSGGSLASQHGGWVATLGTELDDDRIAALSITTEAFFYNLGGGNDLVPGASQPFNDLYRASIAGVVRSSAAGAPGWFGGFSVALGGEDEAPTNESLVVGATGGVRYEVSDRLDLELGVAALSRLEDDAWIWPYIGFRWRANEWLELAAEGTKLEARAKVADHWSLVGRAQYELNQFRLNDDNPLPKGVFRDEQIRAGVGVERRGDDGFSFEVLAGLNLWRELSTLDSSGVKLVESELDPAPFVALSLGLSL